MITKIGNITKISKMTLHETLEEKGNRENREAELLHKHFTRRGRSEHYDPAKALSARYVGKNIIEEHDERIKGLPYTTTIYRYPLKDPKLLGRFTSKYTRKRTEGLWQDALKYKEKHGIMPTHYTFQPESDRDFTCHQNTSQAKGFDAHVGRHIWKYVGGGLLGLAALTAVAPKLK